MLPAQVWSAGAVRYDATEPSSEYRLRRRICYTRQMQISVPGFDIHIDGVWRTFRDRQDAACDAAAALKRKNRQATVTVTNTATGYVATVLEDGRLA